MTHPYAIQRWDADAAADAASHWDDNDRAALVALMRLKPKNAEWADLTERVRDRGSASALWSDDHPRDLFGGGEGDDALLEQAVRDVAEWKHAPFDFHTFMDPSYPDQLRSVRQMPPVVFTNGKLIEADTGVCVVGSRKVTDAGIRFARAVTHNLVAESISVIAGLAEGVDTVAHETALEAGGRTVAVLGNGLNKVYPQSNRILQTEIGARGMLLTHFLPEYAPTRWSFPARNATMSAYAAATIIVEAGERSGTRIQAREAVAHGRPVVLNSSVVLSTTWGRELLHAPGVYVAASADEAIAHIRTILGHRAKITDWLDTNG
ncbi:DNA-protecting protein DprA [Nocardia sp. NEAU-G5]|uniref:DNA-protecting protein DprA n=1 Tax=Nocardia albiluteola TaxID=2842303 RepID=A0ABS6AZK3_9NOCA|nr:DNA-processing protein DprA [Nocardia albiluteola]MBU3063477.1 DNA-protecting protein DprA [Nocardia albiluteola]